MPPGNSSVTNAIVVATNPVKSNNAPMQLALSFPDGSQAGVVKKAAAQADSTATDVAGLKTDFNALLAKLRTAGVIG